jgi:hypothetical protein
MMNTSLETPLSVVSPPRSIPALPLRKSQRTRRWLIERKRMGPLIRNLRLVTDPLFRRAGMSLDER